ncbi:DUF4132 domain-containing protein [Micromonospora sp. NPDC005979]|uniref:DUF4132 domain-containing protein n=1 Tax=Micromonospora sp. NPDC005979 TaxID=3156726 RepID=UPI0033AE68C3
MGDWTALLPHLSDADRRQVETGLAEADERIRAVLRIASTYHWGSSVTSVPEWSTVESWSAEERRRAALALHRGSTSGMSGVMPDLATEDVPFTRADLLWCLDVVARRGGVDDGTDLELPALIAPRLTAAELADLVPALSALSSELLDDHFVTAATRRRTVTLLGQAIDRATGSRLPAWLLHRGDTFGPAVRADLGGDLVEPGVPELLEHCAALDKPAATAKWLRRLDELLVAAHGGRQVVRRLLDAFTAHGRSVHDDTDRLLRGLVWALSRERDERATELLARATASAASARREAAGFPYASRTAIAAVRLLADRDGDVPLRTLARLAVTVRNKAVRSRAQTALTQLGARRGWSLSEVMELAVDDHGLGPDGRLTRAVGPYQATVEIVGERARLVFARDGATLKGVPAQVKQSHEDDLAELRGLVKRIGATLVSERQRVEGLLSEERVWSYPDWSSRFLDHPVTATYGRRLLWETSADGRRWTAGLPRRNGDGWTIVDRDGHALAHGSVRLWHPARADTAEVLAWRAHLVAAGLTQPFKQAFREVYLRTPAEEKTETYSNRFAAHILRYRQANALLRARGWQAGYLGTWDGGRQRSHQGLRRRRMAGVLPP